jgi:COP9 signalosome complex subunit 5
MTTHAAAGVDKGLKSKNAMPVEVMGLMLGHVDTDDPHSIIVTDTFPLPVEGTETTVMTDNPEVVNYMIQLSDSLEAVGELSLFGSRFS